MIQVVVSFISIISIISAANYVPIFKKKHTSVPLNPIFNRVATPPPSAPITTTTNLGGAAEHNNFPSFFFLAYPIFSNLHIQCWFKMA